jgi:hypothetical protein
MTQESSRKKPKTLLNVTGKVQQQAWTEAFAKKSADAFQKSLAQDVVLEANTLVQPVEGIDQVKIVMATASAIYEELVFTQEASNGPRTYLEWQARALGGIELFDITVLSRNAKGEIARVAIHHRPLNAALRFSAELGNRLRGGVDGGYFFNGQPSIE